MRRTGALCLFLLVNIALIAGQIANQVHISFGDNDNSVIVTWSTPTATQFTRARYGSKETFPQGATVREGIQTKFVDNGTLHHTQFIHRVSFPSVSRKMYFYQVWNDTDWSRTFNFIGPGGIEWNPIVTVYGDFGLKNPQTFPALMEELGERATDFIVHNGDFAYDLYADNATFGDNWFNFIEPLYANIPVMTSVGNHEGIYDFLNYRNRFSMPMHKDTQNLFFSYNAGSTHWISYSTEFYFVYEAMEGHGGVHRNFGPYPELAKMQLEFVEMDLIAATAQRHLRPWIFAYGHRPMYCSDSDDDACTKSENQWKTDLENLFYKYGVDIIFEAHQHTYERLWPTMDGKVLNSSTPGQPYLNPLAPVHIVTGAAGCDEDLDEFDDGALGPWSAIRIANYGYGHLNILNHTHLVWEQLDKHRQVADKITIVRDKHVGYHLVA